MKHNSNPSSLPKSENRDNTTNLFHIPPGDSLNNDVKTLAPQNTQGAKEEPDLEKVLQSVKIDPTIEMKPPQVAWEQVASYGDNPIMGSLGNISTVIGKAKSRKSFFVNMVVATLLLEDEFNGFKASLPDDKKRILYFDTEQSTYHVQLATKRICDQIDNPNPSNLDVYALRKFTPAERLKLIEEAIENTPNVGFVVIDGVRDIVTSINDEEQATEVTSHLMRWSEEKQLHVISVLHQNKNDSNARGHIGTELMNKSETVLSVTVDKANKDISVVEAEYCRNIAPERIAFEVINNLPVIVQDYKPRQSNKEQKFDLNNLSDRQRCELLDIAFAYNNEFTYSDLVSQIQVAVKQHYSADVGQNKVKNLITYCKNKNFISQERERAPYTRCNDNNTPF